MKMDGKTCFININYYQKPQVTCAGSLCVHLMHRRKTRSRSQLFANFCSYTYCFLKDSKVQMWVYLNYGRHPNSHSNYVFWAHRVIAKKYEPVLAKYNVVVGFDISSISQVHYLPSYCYQSKRAKFIKFSDFS